MDGNSNKHCLLLSRVSTDLQDYKPQEEQLKRYAESLGYNKYNIINTTESGFRSIDKKEGFNQAIKYFKENPHCKTIIITELSRISRRKIVLEYAKDFLINNNIQLIIKDIGYKLFDNDGKVTFASDIVFSTFASLCEAEMKQKKERFARAKEQLRREGFSHGGKRLFGYDRVRDEIKKKNTYIINNIEATEIQNIYGWYLNGIDNDLSRSSINEIRKQCIISGYSEYLHKKRNVNKALKEAAYIGFKKTSNKRKNPEYWSYGESDKPKYIESTSEMKYPRILSDELFYLVQDKLRSNSNRFEKQISNNTYVDKSRSHVTLLSKLIICPECSSFYLGEYRIKDGYPAHTYRCSKAKFREPCLNKSMISMTVIESAIWAFIKNNITELVSHIQSFYDNTDTKVIEEEIDNIKNKILELSNDIDYEISMQRILKNKSIDKFKSLDNFEKRITTINNEIEHLNIILDEKNKLLEDIKDYKAKNLDNEIKSNIKDIEQDKSLLKKYIRLLINSIIPIYTDKSFTVLIVKTIDSLGKSIIDKNDSNKIPEMKIINSIFSHYLIIDKRSNHRIKLRTLSCNISNFKNGFFEFGMKNYSLSEIFEYNCLDILNEPYLSLSTKNRKELESMVLHFHIQEIEYKKLNIYKEDIPKKNTSLD